LSLIALYYSSVRLKLSKIQSANDTYTKQKRNIIQYIEFLELMQSANMQFAQWLKYKFGGPGTLKKFGALL